MFVENKNYACRILNYINSGWSLNEKRLLLKRIIIGKTKKGTCIIDYKKFWENGVLQDPRALAFLTKQNINTLEELVVRLIEYEIDNELAEKNRQTSSYEYDEEYEEWN